jgi:pyruvate,orthophosphate dikinase
VYAAHGKPLPPDEPYAQLEAAIAAVFRSWMTPRAVKYRQINKLEGKLFGTAVTVQRMVYGNVNDRSASGVAFSRDPDTGERRAYGEYLLDAQGEDVVSGAPTPQPNHPHTHITTPLSPQSCAAATCAAVPSPAPAPPSRNRSGSASAFRLLFPPLPPSARARARAGARTPQPVAEMAGALPGAHADLLRCLAALERHFRDAQDTEFTVQDGELYMLQTRAAKRTGHAALRIAVDLATEGLVDREGAVLLVEPRHLGQMLYPTFEQGEGTERYRAAVLARGLAASPGAAVGQLVFTAEAAETRAASGGRVIMVREETSADDVGGMAVSQGVVTARGGRTSHAAVVARGWGKPCVCGVQALEIDAEARLVRVRPLAPGGEVVVLREGEVVSLNGSTGELLRGVMPLRAPAIEGARAPPLPPGAARPPLARCLLDPLSPLASRHLRVWTPLPHAASLPILLLPPPCPPSRRRRRAGGFHGLGGRRGAHGRAGERRQPGGRPRGARAAPGASASCVPSTWSSRTPRARATCSCS